MANESQVSVRQLKNETTHILRRVEGGEHLIVTKRGKPVAIIEPLNQALVPASDSIYPASNVRSKRELRTCGESRSWQRIVSLSGSRIRFGGRIPYKDWREMDRAAKGDRFGLSRK
jgi:prevent-host-death family protein